VGALSIQVPGLNPVLAGLNPIVVPGATTVDVIASGSGHIDSLILPASPFHVTGLVIPITDPAAGVVKGIQATVHNGGLVPSVSGATRFTFAGPMLNGQMPLGLPAQGFIKFCLFSACSINTQGNLSVPLSIVGVARTTAVPPGTSSTVIGALTLHGAPWTAGVAAVGTATQMGFRHGPASASSSTVEVSGAIRLVTPIFVSTNIPGSAVIPDFAFLDLHFVPEPSSLLLLGGGIAALVMFGRSRRG